MNMNIEIIKQDKNEIELKIDNITVAEILREYLNRQNVDFVAWRREHPTKPVIMRIQSSEKTIKKEVSEAIESIKKDIQSWINIIKK